MARMQKLAFMAFSWVVAQAFAQEPQPTEAGFRKHLDLAPTTKLEYRNLDCKPGGFTGFVDGMRQAVHRPCQSSSTTRLESSRP
jgi:hypothetical protein